MFLVVTYSPEQYTVYYTTNSSGCPADSDEGYNKSVTVYGLNHTNFFTIRDQQYNVTLTNLYPDTVYCYKVVATNTEVRSTVNVVECEVVSRNTAVDSKFSVIMLPCDTAGSAVVLVRISASIADKRDVVIN